MTFFRERNKTRNEYSGYQDVSPGLRSRLNAVCENYIARGYIGVGNERYWIPIKPLNHEIKLHLNKDSIAAALSGAYDEVFEAIEIFLSKAMMYASRRHGEILGDIATAFDISGSVYFVNFDTGHIELRISEKLAEDIDTASVVLSDTRSAKEEFLSAVGGLINRKESPEDVVKDVFIAFEDYLKEKTGSEDYGGALSVLAKNKTISSTQKALLDKIYAYRSDTYGVGHAGNSEKPKEVDALWFIETTTAQLLFIDRKLKQDHD